MNRTDFPASLASRITSSTTTQGATAAEAVVVLPVLALDHNGKYYGNVAPSDYCPGYTPTAFACTAPPPDSGPAVVRVADGQGWFQSLVLSLLSLAGF